MKTFFSISFLITAVTMLSSDCLYAQSTVIKLSRIDTMSNLIVTDVNDVRLMRLNADGGFCLFGNPSTSYGRIPVEGDGARLMWYPAKKAFRAGYIYTDDHFWDNVNIGISSVAMGEGTTASAYASTALNGNTTASGRSSIAMGQVTTASGDNSTATGRYTTASGYCSIATGQNTTASGSYSTAMGYYSIASGNYSTAMGYLVSTNSCGGSCIIGDTSSTTITLSSSANEMTMRFAGGYRLFTNAACTTGVTLAAGASSWATISDSTKKSNFETADGESFLNGLSKLRLGSWNYKGQDVKSFRHYGPMAQEIFHYFGKDNYGTIGNETTLASADMDGIMMICLQALENRTTELKKTEAELQKANEKITVLEKNNSEMLKRIERLEQITAASASSTKQFTQE